jgi:hypothetical protein
MVQHPRLRLWGLRVDCAAVREQELGTGWADLIEWVIRRYGAQQETWWIDHTPTNMLNAATLLEMFPGARMIHIVRDGRAVAASVLPLDWGPNTVLHAASWWVRNVSFGLAAELRWGAAQVLRVHYEDLVRQPAPELRRICGFLGLAYEPAMAQARGFRAPSYTARQHALVGAPPDATRATAFERELTIRQIEIFESLCGDFLYCLGYEPKFGLRALPPTKRELIAAELKQQSMRLLNHLRKAARFRRALARAGSVGMETPPSPPAPQHGAPERRRPGE